MWCCFQTGHNLANVHQNPDTTVTTQAAIDSVMKAPGIPAYVKKQLVYKIGKDSAVQYDKNGKKIVSKDTKVQNWGFISPTGPDSTYKAYMASQQKLPADERDGFIERYYNKKAYQYKEEYGDRTKDVIIDEFKHNIPKMMFLLLPICALIMMVAFRKNHKYYVEHLIYSFHLHCFIFLFLAMIMVLQWMIAF